MTESDLPNLDYVNRCIKSLRQLKETIQPGNQVLEVINQAIIICEAYKQQVPSYQPPFPTRPMPPRKNRNENSNNS